MQKGKHLRAKTRRTESERFKFMQIEGEKAQNGSLFLEQSFNRDFSFYLRTDNVSLWKLNENLRAKHMNGIRRVHWNAYCIMQMKQIWLNINWVQCKKLLTALKGDSCETENLTLNILMRLNKFHHGSIIAVQSSRQSNQSQYKANQSR